MRDRRLMVSALVQLCCPSCVLDAGQSQGYPPVWVRTLAEDIVFCSRARYFTLTVSLKLHATEAGKSFGLMGHLYGSETYYDG